MDKEQIAAILKKIRQDARLTQKQVSALINRPQQTIASWETGKSQPDANTLFELCNIYGTTVDIAFGYEKPVVTQPQLIEKISRLDPDDLKTIESNVDFLLSQAKYEATANLA
jgi:transcriptional regulator with XRE-family HTH domain